MTTLEQDARHRAVIDLGFGDAGKGTVVDRLCAAGDVDLVVRFSGGAQAAHRVVVGDRAHVFHQFGSGTLAGMPTHLAPGMMVEPYSLVEEALDLVELGVDDPFALLSVDPACLLTTPVHAAVNRWREEQRGDAAHGSCGRGIGETTAYALEHPAPTVADTRDRARLVDLLDRMCRHYTATCGPDLALPAVAEMADVYDEFAATVTVDPAPLRRALDVGRVVFEGSQGVLLDEWYGFHPHTTWSTLTPQRLRAQVPDLAVIGVTRTYQTRHGAGPFPSENPAWTALLPEAANGTGRYQGPFRVGPLDPLLLRYAIAACGGIDGLAVTHLDRLDVADTLVDAHVLDDTRRADLPGPFAPDPEYVALGRLTQELFRTQAELRSTPTDPEQWCAGLERDLGAPVVLATNGPDREQHLSW